MPLFLNICTVHAQIYIERKAIFWYNDFIVCNNKVPEITIMILSANVSDKAALI